jgi:hypothetical protein
VSCPERSSFGRRAISDCRSLVFFWWRSSMPCACWDCVRCTFVCCAPPDPGFQGPSRRRHG